MQDLAFHYHSVDFTNKQIRKIHIIIYIILATNMSVYINMSVSVLQAQAIFIYL